MFISVILSEAKACPERSRRDLMPMASGMRSFASLRTMERVAEIAGIAPIGKIAVGKATPVPREG